MAVKSLPSRRTTLAKESRRGQTLPDKEECRNSLHQVITTSSVSAAIRHDRAMIAPEQEGTKGERSVDPECCYRLRTSAADICGRQDMRRR